LIFIFSVLNQTGTVSALLGNDYFSGQYPASNAINGKIEDQKVSKYLAMQ
jgi:hypothetical protein